MNTCKVYVCDIRYDARSLYKCINAKWTTPAQAEIAEDVFNSLPTNFVVDFDAMGDWNTHKAVLKDWTLPFMIRDEIFRQIGWRIISFDIAGITVNDNFIPYDQDLTFEFKNKREYNSSNETEEDEVVAHNKDTDDSDEASV
jgi:hypothetical protein